MSSREAKNVLRTVRWTSDRVGNCSAADWQPWARKRLEANLLVRWLHLRHKEFVVIDAHLA